MRRGRYNRGFRKPGRTRGFTRRKRRVVWATTGQGTQSGQESVPIDGTQYFWPLEGTTNPFIGENTRGVFAKQDDTITYARILGMLQLGIYAGSSDLIAIATATDLLVSVGVVFIEGDYANDGTWTATREPRPADHLDDSDPWFFQYHTIMNFGYGETVWPAAAPTQITTIPLMKPSRVSFSRQVDTAPYRKAKYGQKLHIGAQVLTSEEASWEAHSLFLNWNFRILQSEWG